LAGHLRDLGARAASALPRPRGEPADGGGDRRGGGPDRRGQPGGQGGRYLRHPPARGPGRLKPEPLAIDPGSRHGVGMPMTSDAMTMPRRSLVLVLGVFLLLAPRPASADPDGFNKANLRFNQWFLEHVMEPVGRGWNFVVPKWGQRRVVSFMENLVAPRDILNSLLQAKWKRAGLH